jgi:maleylpyruvate isomerase
VSQLLPSREAVSAPAALDWAYEGQQRVEDAAATLSDAEARAPSALSGWSRGHVLTHLARNADALVNLLTWARTGVPTPMYASPEQRDADIEAGAGRPAEELRADLRDSGQRFRDAASALSEEGWTASVRTRAGREIAAAEVPWLRVREVWLHLVDLSVGAAVDDVPTEVARQLVIEVADWMSSRVDVAVDLLVAGQQPIRMGPGDPVGEVQGPASVIAGWLTGRCGASGLTTTGRLVELPAWL